MTLGVDEGLNINVMCPFFDDPPPAGEPGPTDKLWEHEVAEAFFLAAYSNGTNRLIRLTQPVSPLMIWTKNAGFSK